MSLRAKRSNLLFFFLLLTCTAHAQEFPKDHARALAKLKAGHYTAAYDYFEKARLHTPDDAELLKDMGITAIILKKYDAANAHLMKSFKLDPEDFRTYLALYDLASAQGQVDQQQQWANLLTEHFPNLYLGHALQGAMLAKAGKLKAALAKFEQAKTKNPQDPYFESDRALLLAKLGQKEQAIEILEKLVKEAGTKEPLFQKNLKLLKAIAQQH